MVLQCFLDHLLTFFRLRTVTFLPRRSAVGPCAYVAMILLGLTTLSWGAALPEPEVRVTPASFELTIPQGWRIYGPTSGEGSPLKTTIDASTTNNLRGVEVQWPKGDTQGIYTGTLSVPYTLNAADPDADDPYAELLLEGGMCGTLCVPFSLRIPLGIPPAMIHPLLGLVLALFAGLMLNVMPCVWPLLLSKLRHLGKTPPTKARPKALATLAGVLAFFVTLGGLAAGAQKAGSTFLWGEHFQHTGFLYGLSAVLMCMGLIYILPPQWLPGWVMRPWTALQSWSSTKLQPSQKAYVGYSQDFTLGWFSGLLASPCTGPFLMAALAISFTHTGLYTFLFFLMVGLGYGAPYVLILITPRLVHALPSPGFWMTSIEKLGGAALIATSLFFAYAAMDNDQDDATEAAIALSKPASPAPAFSYKFPTQPLAPEAIPQLVRQGKTVFVITTAPWCLTCAVTKKTTFADSKVIDALSQPNVVVMVGVLTKKATQVRAYLSSLGSPGVPTYRLYTPQHPYGHKISELPKASELLGLLRF